MKKKPKKPEAKVLVASKPVTKASHVQLSAKTLCEVLGAHLNNMHNNEGKSLPAYSLVVIDPNGDLYTSTNIVRAIDEARAYAGAITNIMRGVSNIEAPEVFKDRGPRIQRLD